MYKVYLVESVPTIREAFCDIMAHSCQVLTCERAENALEEMIAFRPDILVLDMSMPGVDGFALVDHAYMLGVRPKVLVSTILYGGILEDRLLRYGAGTALMRPFTVSHLAKVTMDILLDLEAHGNTSPRQIANDLLLLLGFRVDLQGYRYVLEAVAYASEHMDCMIFGEIYPYVAKKCGVTIAVVERAMRGCIDKAWLMRDDRVWNLYFSKDHNGSTRHVTNGVFVKRLGLAVNEFYGYIADKQMAE